MTDVYLFIYLYIYLSVRNALPMIPLSQVKVSYIPRFYRSPLKHLFSYYCTLAVLNDGCNSTLTTLINNTKKVI